MNRNVFGFTALLLFLLCAGVAWGHGPDYTPEETQWMERQHAVDGTKCCDRHDTVVGPDVEWRIHNGQYQVLIDGSWHPVPAELVIRRTSDNPWPNQAIVTYSVYPGGRVRIWCLWPGVVM